MKKHILLHPCNGVPHSKKMKGPMIHATKWMNHKNILLSKTNQTHKKHSYKCIYMMFSKDKLTYSDRN